MEPRIRPFKIQDADEMLLLYNQYGVWFEDIGLTADFIISSAQRPDFTLQIAEQDNQLTGFAGSLYLEKVGRAELGPIAVKPEHQNKGVGGILLDTVITELKARNIRRIFVKVKASNLNAISFFMSHGFGLEAYHRDYTMKHEDVVEMTLHV